MNVVNIIRITFVKYYILVSSKNFGVKLPEDSVYDAGM
jgi:hypothetical protein